MNFSWEHVAHTTFLKNEYCFAFRRITRKNVKGKFFWSSCFHFIFFSYDGDIFHNQADSKIGHYAIALANIDEAPLAVGGANSWSSTGGADTNKAEILDIESNTWTEAADYPYHNL